MPGQNSCERGCAEASLRAQATLRAAARRRVLQRTAVPGRESDRSELLT